MKWILVSSGFMVLFFSAFWMSMVKGHYKALSADYLFLSAVLFLLFNVNCLVFWKVAVRKGGLNGYILAGLGMLETALLTYGLAWFSVYTGAMRYQPDVETWLFGGVANFYPVFWSVFPTVGWSIAVFLLYHYREQLLGLLQIKQSLNKTTQAWRRAQLDPHLLKYLLVTVRAINYRHPELTAEACDLLVSIMNFHVGTNAVADRIFFVEEWEQVLKWLKLLKLKHGDNLHFQHNIEGNIDNVRVIPMTVMVLMENMVSDADLTNAQIEALISARFADGVLTIRSYNWIRQIKQGDGSGTGLDNMRDRLEANYPGRYSLNASQENDLYKVELTIMLAKKKKN